MKHVKHEIESLALPHRVLADVLLQLLRDRVHAVFDIETTELIDRSVPLADMTISCASVLLLNPSDPAPIDTAEIVTFWNPVRCLETRSLLRSCPTTTATLAAHPRRE